MSVPVPTDLSAATYDGITSIIRKKKTREASALRRAAQNMKQDRERRVVARAAAVNNVHNGEGEEGQGQSNRKARERANSKIRELRNELNKLLMQRTELEKSVQYQWKEKINDFEQTSLKEEEEEMNKLRQEHERELKQLPEKMRSERQQHAEEEARRKGKRKAAREEMDVSRKKRLKVGEDSTTGHTDDGSRDQITVAEKGKIRHTEIDKDDDPLGNGDAENQDVSLKAKELEEITKEMDYLNKTKSQMIWLLKQVITAEKKQKLR